MNGNDERGLDPMDTDTLIGGRHAQRNNVASVPNASHSTFKIDSLSIKLGIVKEKGDAQKCKHFSIRGYVAELRETGRSNLLPFTDELPPMDVPNFRYWLCQMCLQNSGTASPLHETPSVVSGCNQCVLQPVARPSLPQNRAGVAALPFGEGTSGLKPVDSKNDDKTILSALGANQTQSSQEIPPSVAVSKEVTNICSVDTNDAAEVNAGSPGQRETIDSRVHEDPQQTSMVQETVTSPENQPTQQDQQNEYPNGHPRRKTRKVRLLKELLTNENVTPSLGPRACSTSAPSSQLKRKMLHNQVQDQRADDVTTAGHAGKKAKISKGNEIAKNNVVGHSKDPGISEGGETINKFQWNKVGTQRSATLGRGGNDADTAWRSIFSNIGRKDNNQVVAPIFTGMAREDYVEPYSNFMAPPKPDKKTNSSKKISSNPPKRIFFGEGSRTDVGGSRPNDLPSDTELGLGLSLNFDPHAMAFDPQVMARASNQDHSRRAGFFFGEPAIAPRMPSDPTSNEGLVHDVSNRYAPGTAYLQDQQPYTQFPYGSCSGPQKLDFSDPYKRNIGFGGYSDIPRPHDHQRQEHFSIGRSDEREVVELLAKNQYERSLCEASRFAPNGNSNSGMPNASGFRNVNMNEGMTSSAHMSFNMMRPTSENAGPNTIRNPPASFYHQDRVSSFTFDDLRRSQKHPSNGVWVSDSVPPRHPNSPYIHHAPGSDNKMAHGHTYLYPSTNPQVPESFNMYRNGAQQNDVFSNTPISIPFSDPYANYSDKDKGKNMMNLDLNLVAPNVVEEQNNFESTDLNQKHMRPIDSSYSNEAIPAMQLLSLMDAGQPSRPLNTDARKDSTRPLSTPYSHSNSRMTGKQNSIANSHLSYSGMRPGVPQYPTESSRQVLSPPRNSSSLAVGKAFNSVFRTDQNVKLPSSQKPRGTSAGSVSHNHRLEDSLLFPLPWHATEDRNKLVTMKTNRSFVPRYESLGTEVCMINRNPADFTTPGAENIYMINPDNLVVKGKSSSKVKASVSINELKTQKKVVKPTS